MKPNQSEFLKELLKKESIGSKNKVRCSLLIVMAAICIIGIGSSYFMGPDNPVEELTEDIAEEIIDDYIEVKIELPGEPPMKGYIDFTPGTPEKKKAVIDNS